MKKMFVVMASILMLLSFVACNNNSIPIGGVPPFSQDRTQTFNVSSLSALLNALSRAGDGDIVVLDGVQINVDADTLPIAIENDISVFGTARLISASATPSESNVLMLTAADDTAVQEESSQEPDAETDNTVTIFQIADGTSVAFNGFAAVVDGAATASKISSIVSVDSGRISASAVSVSVNDSTSSVAFVELGENSTAESINGNLAGVVVTVSESNANAYEIAQQIASSTGAEPAVNGEVFSVYNETKKTGYTTFNEAIKNAESGDRIKLTSDITLTERCSIEKTITLDLAGYAISIGDEFEQANTGMITIYDHGNLTINDSSEDGSGLIDATEKSDNTSSDAEVGNNVVSTAVLVFPETVDGGATLILNGGTIKGPTYGISGNGGKRGEGYPKTTINLKGGSVISTEGTGIYHPQDGTITITDDTVVTGKKTALEIRGGSAIITGGTFTSETASQSVGPNGNGPTSEGAAIAVAQHTHKLPVDVKISGGTFNAYTPFYQTNPQNNPEEDIDKVTVSITGGEFNSTENSTCIVYSENMTGFITGGTFNVEPTDSYIAEGYAAIDNGGSWVVQQN